MVGDESTPAEIVRLKARVRALERALQRKSVVLRILERELCPQDSIRLTRILTTGSPYPGSDPSLLGADDAVGIQASDVEGTLAQVWRSLAIPHGGVEE